MFAESKSFSGKTRSHTNYTKAYTGLHYKVTRNLKWHFFSYGSTALYVPGPPCFVEVSRSHTLDTPQSVGLLWTRDQLVADNTQHSQETDIHAPGGIFFLLSGVFPL
jgi:hypothetical protein